MNGANRESAQVLTSGHLPPKIAVSTKEAAELSGVSERTIQQYVAAKLLPSRKIGARRLILVRDLQKFLSKDQPFVSIPNLETAKIDSSPETQKGVANE